MFCGDHRVIVEVSLPDGSPTALSAADAAIVEEEQRLLTAVRDAIRATTQRRDHDPVHERFYALREEAMEAKEADLPALLAEMRLLQIQSGISRQGELPDPRLPYFAHIRLRAGDRHRDVLLGYRTFIEPGIGIAIVDWRAAPIARVFFRYEEGDEYEEEFPGRLATGVLEQRRVLTFDRGELIGIQTAGGDLRRHRDDAWFRDDAAVAPALAGGAGGPLAKQIIGTGLSGRREPVVSALLDEDQYAALERDDDRPLLVIGGAGCGKTTVALHRLAALHYRHPERYRPDRMLVVVPEEGLARLTRSLLEELQMDGVQVATFDHWIEKQARTLFRGLPRKVCQETPLRVSRFKRHPAMRAALQQLADRLGAGMARFLDERLGARGRYEASYALREDANPLERLQGAVREYRRGQPKAERQRVRSLVRSEQKRFLRVVQDREPLLLDRDLMRAAVDASGGELTLDMADAVLDHSASQLRRSSEERYDHVDADRLQALDGRALDDGTPSEVAGTIDPEDYVLLLELHRLKTGGLYTPHGQLSRYTHLVVDEAQDLAPLELGLLGKTLKPGGTMTVAGDPAQQIDTTVAFGGWDAVLDALHVRDAQPIQLHTTYRCTHQIARFAHGVLGPLAPAESPRAVKDGAPVLLTHAANPFAAAVSVAGGLTELLRREPHACAAVIARSRDEARRLHDALSHGPRVRLVLAGEFTFRPGVDITTVSQIKGLEFDYVVVPDAAAHVYPDEPAARRQLHVAASRAIHQLWVVTVGRRSPILPDETTDLL